MPTVARINIHPVKSLDPQMVAQAVLLPSGALEHDRRFALCDRQGDFINAKSTPAVHGLRGGFDPQTRQLALRIEGTSEVHTFDVDAQRAGLCRWLSDFFGEPVELLENG